MCCVPGTVIARAPPGRVASSLRGPESRRRSGGQGAGQSAGSAIPRRRTRHHDRERPRTGRHLRAGHLGPHHRRASSAAWLRPIGVHRPAGGAPPWCPVPAPAHARIGSATNRCHASRTTRRPTLPGEGCSRSDPRTRPRGRRRDHHRVNIACRGPRPRGLGMVRCRRGCLRLDSRRPSFDSGQSGQSPYGRDRRGLIVLHEHSVNSQAVGGVHVRLHVVEERRLV